MLPCATAQAGQGQALPLERNPKANRSEISVAASGSSSRAPQDSRRTTILVFALLLLVAFGLRIFYAGHLFQDDGLWFTAAEELLRGKALYRDIYFDKPPVLPLVYALLFKLFGAHILTIRLFTIGYSVAVAFVLYRFNSRLYDRRAGFWAAAMFVVFSTTYTTGHVQGLNTDFLMTLPYALAAYLFTVARLQPQATRRARRWQAFAAGIAAGVAFQTNPKAAVLLVFFALCAGVGRRGTEDGEAITEDRLQRRQQQSDAEAQQESPSAGAPQTDDAVTAVLQRDTPYATLRTRHMSSPTPDPRPPTPSLLQEAAGFVIGALPFLAYLAMSGALADYWTSVWRWGAKYTGYYGIGESLTTAARQSFGYFALNTVLLTGLMFVAARVFQQFRRRLRKAEKAAPTAGSVSAYGASARAIATPARGLSAASANELAADVVLLVWFAASYLGMSAGGRFFGHYFLQILPSLCLLGGRGVPGLLAWIAASNQKVRRWRGVIIVLLFVGCSITVARFHARTAALAADWARGASSETNRDWFHERLKREERLAAAAVKGMSESEEDVARLGIEELRRHPSPKHPSQGREDSLFVWGYRPELYFWSGLQPASRFLSSQLLTGVPADVHYFGDDFVPVLDAATTAAYRAQLLSELRANPPAYIVDELGFFNNQLAMSAYPELQDFLREYRFWEARGRFLIYHRRTPKEEKNRGGIRQ